MTDPEVPPEATTDGPEPTLDARSLVDGWMSVAEPRAVMSRLGARSVLDRNLVHVASPADEASKVEAFDDAAWTLEEVGRRATFLSREERSGWSVVVVGAAEGVR
jgi:hypothetical protein